MRCSLQQKPVGDSIFVPTNKIHSLKLDTVMEELTYYYVKGECVNTPGTWVVFEYVE